MCLPQCHAVVRQQLERQWMTRRRFGAGLVVGTAAASATRGLPMVTAAEPKETMASHYPAFSQILDLTHPLTAHFPTYSGKEQFAKQQLTSREQDGYLSYAWSLQEHTGTHIDAPLHFAHQRQSMGEIPIQDLVLPLCVIDIRQKAEADPDARLRLQDIHQWERLYGPVPAASAVAMNSGWDQHIHTAKFRGVDDQGVLHFPGFHEDAADFLMNQRRVAAILVDTLSLDYGMSTTFPVHCLWLPANRWGVECVANLSSLPPTGATLIAACLRVPSSSGGPLRLIALL